MLTKRSFASQKQKYINVIPSYLNMLNDLQKVFVNFAKKKGHL
ncbi:hypothetical protein CU040_1442 [Enterococcus faecium]|nr:hypothetical protein [Enterococcus faecium]MBK4786788.1 hypothetical protein [Enterococcus faecium]MBK4874011.1 hypothetical protein [Enterococcus faecium]